MMTEYVDELTSRLLILPSGLQYVWHIEAGICAAVQLYVGRLEKLCLRDLPEEERGTVDDDTDESDSDIGTITVNAPHAPSQYISMSLCVKVTTKCALRDISTYSKTLGTDFFCTQTPRSFP